MLAKINCVPIGKVTTKETTETYIGLTATEFKTRWRKHQISTPHMATLNKRNELIPTCRHREKYILKYNTFVTHYVANFGFRLHRAFHFTVPHARHFLKFQICFFRCTVPRM